MPEYLSLPRLITRQEDNLGNVYVEYVDETRHALGETSGLVLLRDAPVYIQEQAHRPEFKFDRD